MATKKAVTKARKATRTPKKETKVEVPTWLTEAPVSQPALKTRADMANTEEGLDPQEEKILDWILKGVVGFVLVWLGVSVLMVIGGLFHLWG